MPARLVARFVEPTEPAQASTVIVRSIGGPTASLEFGGFRFLTDPTFDPPGPHPVGDRVLDKTEGPALPTEALGSIDAVLLSHHQHPDNLDRSGRQFLDHVPLILTTPDAAASIGAKARGMEPWDTLALAVGGRGNVDITAVPARHGPPGAESQAGVVIGFVLAGRDLPSVYVSGDNASLDIVRQIGERTGPIAIAILFAGAARTALLGGAYLTLTSEEAAEATRILGAAAAVPVHFSGWRHFTEGGQALRRSFEAAGLGERLALLGPGAAVGIDIG